jgi:hypothetical protein
MFLNSNHHVLKSLRNVIHRKTLALWAKKELDRLVTPSDLCFTSVSTYLGMCPPQRGVAFAVKTVATESSIQDAVNPRLRWQQRPQSYGRNVVSETFASSGEVFFFDHLTRLVGEMVALRKQGFESRLQRKAQHHVAV